MSNFKIKVKGLDKLSKSLKNMEKQANSFNGTLKIDVDNIKNNISSFNSNFGTDFTTETSNEDFQQYFNDKYVELMSKHITDTFNYKAHFNKTYLDYAHID